MKLPPLHGLAVCPAATGVARPSANDLADEYGPDATYDTWAAATECNICFELLSLNPDGTPWTGRGKAWVDAVCPQTEGKPRGHSFHKECIQNVYQTASASNEVAVCPDCRDPLVRVGDPSMDAQLQRFAAPEPPQPPERPEPRPLPAPPVAPSLTLQVRRFYMRNMVWMLVPPPSPDSVLGRGETLYDFPGPLPFPAYVQGARASWQRMSTGWTRWLTANSTTIPARLQEAVSLCTSTLGSMGAALRILEESVETSRLQASAESFLEAMFNLALQTSAVREVALIEPTGMPNARGKQWGNVMRRGWHYYRALGQGNPSIAEAQQVALSRWRVPR